MTNKKEQVKQQMGNINDLLMFKIREKFKKVDETH